VPESPSYQGLALVLTGGGARAAYQVGILRYLAREFPAAVPDILTGVSAGGINAAFLAARQESYADKVEQLANMWSDLHIDDVFRVDVRDLAWRSIRWSGRLASGGQSPLPPAKSLVDTEPLRRVLVRELRTEDGPTTASTPASTAAGCARSRSRPRATPPASRLPGCRRARTR
jgi:NTE family protein